MESISHLSVEMRARLDALMQRAAERDAEAQREHEERMASLPLGTCPLCYGTKRMDRYGQVVPCAECDPPLMHAPGVPVEFQRAMFSNYVVTDGNTVAVTKAKSFLTGARDLFLTGGVGAGKTRLACTMANEAFFSRVHTLFVRVPMVLHQLQPGRNAEDVASLERQLFNTALLVLDDIGAERDMATDYTRRTLLMIYEERGDRGLRTIFTSNKTVQELAEMQADDRLASRIAGRADAAKLTTPDQRMLRRVK